MRQVVLSSVRRPKVSIRSSLSEHAGPLLLGIVTVLSLASPLTARQPQSAAGLRVVAGSGTAGFQDGLQAQFNKPIRLAPYRADAILVADIFNHAIRVVNKAGMVWTLTGGPDRKGHRDGPADQAMFASPHGVAYSASGVIAVAEAENHTVRLLTPVVGGEEGLARRYVVSTLAGIAGQEGMRDGTAADALFRSPHAVAWTEDGSLLVSDIGNARIRRIQGGQVTTVAGSGAIGKQDGAALEATFTYPMDIALESGGSLLVADAGTHSIRRWLPAGRVETLTLGGELHTPHGIAVGREGSVFVADMQAHRIVAVNPEGEVQTVCGTGSAGSLSHELNRPAAVLVHAGMLWVADLENHRISALPLP